MMMGKIKCAVVGVGNCFAGLVQGIEYYRQNPDQKVIGIMHEDMGGYTIHDIDFVAAFDVDSKKVGKPLNEAVYAEPNKVRWVESLPAMGDVIVGQSPQLDGVGDYVKKKVDPVEDRPTDELKEKIMRELKEKKVEIIVSYLPVGSDNATKFWAQVCLDSGVAFVNCMPSFIASDPQWASKFEDANIPIIGDDIKGQVGATIVHRTLAKLCDMRGTKIEKTYQINVGGNSVTGDQEIILNIDDKIMKGPIGDFIDTMVEMYGEKREDGKDIVDVGTTGKNIQCYTIDKNFRSVPADVRGLIRHKLNEELFEIETYEGRKIKITKDHNVFTLNPDGELEETAIRDLKEKESMIAVPKKIPVIQKQDLLSINLSPHLRELFAQGIDKDGNIIVHNHPEMKIPVNFPITDELLQLIGIWIADGSYDRKGSCNVELACGHEPECMDIVNNFTKTHNLNYSVKGQKQVAVRIMSKTISKIFKLALGLDGNAYTKRIPSWIFDLSERQISLVLKGYMSGDGTVSGKQIRWTTASPLLAEDIRTLLLMTGINSTIIKEDYTKKKTKSSFKTNLDFITHGTISSREEIGAFIEKIGFIHSEKNKRALDAFTKLKKGHNYVVPKIDLMEKWGIKTATWGKVRTLKAYSILSQIEKVKDKNQENRIKNIFAGDVGYLKIKKIRKIKASPQYVYDLNVPGVQRFICSNILVHNTDFLTMKEQDRLTSKRISKTESVQSQLSKRLPDDDIYVGPSDFIPFLGNTKLMFMRIEGRMWANIPYNMEVRLEVDDKANSAGIVVDAVRAVKIALDRKIGGPIIGPSAYLMKHPPEQMADSDARQAFEDSTRNRGSN
jgi:myo-inositol-1-phosphate synthase